MAFTGHLSSWFLKAERRRKKLQAVFHLIPVDIVVNMIAPSLTSHQADVFEYSQVLRNSRLGYTQKIGQSIDAKGVGVALPAKQFHQFEASRVC